MSYAIKMDYLVYIDTAMWDIGEVIVLNLHPLYKILSITK